MNTEPELLNERLERLAIVLDEIMPHCALLVRDAISLLKEQEHKQILVKWSKYIPYCGNCGERLDVSDEVNYCPKCGQKVKWE